jgi:hypothetical protein
VVVETSETVETIKVMVKEIVGRVAAEKEGVAEEEVI